jgi:cytochrome c peroxidase
VRKSILTIFSLLFLVFSISYLLGSCRKEQQTKGLILLSQEIPDGFPKPLHRYNDNPFTKEGFELGKKLFYDGRLSIDNLHPCSSCHQQVAAFGTFEHDRSHGVYESHTLRNAPVLFNLAWSPLYHWDGEFTSLREEAAQPMNGHIEMGESFKGIINKIQGDVDYQRMFKKVFNYPLIRPEYILKALEQFTGSLISANAKYDRYKKGLATYTLQEENGYQLYKTKCAGCHPEPLFTDYTLRNIGLQVDPFLNDYGRMRITGKSEDSLKFKVPTLRNTSISSNYMHDGRFNTLQQCLNHYSTGVQQSPTLDPLLTGGIPLTNTESTELYAFLKTLTDSAFIKDPYYQLPR